MNLTREHIIFTLGIELPLNESLDNLSEDLKKHIISEQMIYENFIDSIKKYASEKWDKVVTTITDWKDAAVILGKVITDPKTLSNFSDQLWKYFKRNILGKLTDLLKKLKLDSYIPQIEDVVNKITDLTGWQKFLAAASLASITQYIITKLSNLSAEGLTKWIKSYFSSEVISTITSKLTDFSTYVGWLQPIIKGTEILYDVLKPIIDKFKYAFSLKRNPTPQTENKMNKELLKQLIKEEMSKLTQEAIQGTPLNIDLIISLDSNLKAEKENIKSAVTAIKTNTPISVKHNQALAKMMIAMIKSSNDETLTKIFQNLKSMEAK